MTALADGIIPPRLALVLVLVLALVWPGLAACRTWRFLDEPKLP